MKIARLLKNILEGLLGLLIVGFILYCFLMLIVEKGPLNLLSGILAGILAPVIAIVIAGVLCKVRTMGKVGEVLSNAVLSSMWVGAR